MLLFNPFNDFFMKFPYTGNEFINIFICDSSNVIVFRNIPFAAASVEIIGICFMLGSQDNRQRLNSPEMLKGFFGKITFRI